MRWIVTPQLWILLGAAVSVIAEQQPLLHQPAQSTVSLAPGDQHKAAEAALLVSEARAILRTLDPNPFIVPDGGSGKGGLVGKLWHYFRQLLLWHNAESLEEKRAPKMVPELGRAVEKLEKAREIAKDADALFLLAEMNFYGNWSHPRNYEAAFERYKELADMNGNSTAQSIAGFMYATGVGAAVRRDQGKALLYHMFAALNGDTRSEMTVAFRNHQGIATPRRCEEAVYYYKRVADKAISWWESGPPGGHHIPKHTFRLADDVGGVYGEGASAISSGLNWPRQKQSLDNTRDLEDIVEYLELLARKGGLPETISLGQIYYDGGRNLPRDLRKAKEYFLKVARQYWERDGKAKKANAPAYVEKFAGRAAGHLGTMALRGEAGSKDTKAALRWFDLGSSCGNAGSQNGLGFLYLHGIGVKEDRNKAATLFRAAASQDHPLAQVNFAKMLLENSDIERAKRYLELAARHGNIEAFYYLAEINNTGAARDGSCGLATTYYKIVAERVEPVHSPMAWANAAYDAGDLESALIGYMMAAEQGYESAQANVAYLLDGHHSALPLKRLLGIKSEGKSKKVQELALIYWTRSAKQANTDSLVKMGDYYLSGIGAERDAAKAASCYSAASEHQASAQAIWNLGWMHENGIGVEQDFHLAKRYYDLAFEANGEAYLPVTLSLLKLRIRAFWNAVTNGGVNPIGPEPRKKRLSLQEFVRNWYQAAAEADVTEADDEDEFGYEEDFDEDLVESVVILGLAAAVAALVYYRQWRQQRRAEEERRRNAQAGGGPGAGAGAGGDAGAGGGNGQQQPPPAGIWNDGMPGWGMPH